MFNSMEKNFKSPVSTISPRGQVLAFVGKSADSDAGFDTARQPLKTRQPGTVTQNPAQSIAAMPQAALTPSFQRYFWSQVNQSGDCWPWLSSLASDGYGRVRTPGDRAHYRAHRIAYFITHGVDPGQLFVCHSCDNPKCCNPAHFFLGDAAANNADKHAKGRARNGVATGASNPNAKMTEADAREVIRLLMLGWQNTQIANTVAVGHAMVSRIRVGRSWIDLARSVGYEPKASRLAPKSGRTAHK